MSNKIPITRLGKFFDHEDFNLDLQIGEEYLMGDLNFKVVLFRVDRTVKPDDIYGEAPKDGIKTHPPVEIYGTVEFDKPKNEQYGKGGLRYLEAGKMTVHVYTHHLEAMGIDILYGDYIGYSEKEDRVRYFSVVNDGKITNDHEHSIGGYKGFYRTIECAPVQENEFRGM